MNGTNGTNGINGSNGTTNGSNGTSTGAKLLWRHSSPESTPMYQYLQRVNEAYGLRLSTYPELYQWSIDNIDSFWHSVWDFVGVRAQGRAARVSYHSPKQMLVR